MCDHCVIEKVRERMLGRRDLFRGAASVTAAAAVATATAAVPARAAAHSGVVDLTHTYGPDFPTYFGEPGVSVEVPFTFAEHGFNLKVLRVNEHTGTHIDAPLHFSADGTSVDAIPVESLVCPLCVVNIHEKASEDADAMVTPDDLSAWIAANGPIPDNACVAMHSGWERHIGSDTYRNADDNGVQHFPGFHPEAAKMLLEETGAVGIASDTLSLDVGSSTTFDTHYAWLPANRWGLESVANLASVPVTGATLIVGASKHAGGTGGPARVMALV